MADAIQMLVQTLQKETGIAEFNFKQGKVSGHEVKLEDNSIEELTGVDSTGDYIEPSVDTSEVIPSTPESKDQQVKNTLQEWYEAGIITEEEYKEAIGYDYEVERNAIAEIMNGGSSGSNSDVAIAQECNERAEAARASSTNGRQGQVVEGEYGQGDYSGLEHIRIN